MLRLLVLHCTPRLSYGVPEFLPRRDTRNRRGVPCGRRTRAGRLHVTLELPGDTVGVLLRVNLAESLHERREVDGGAGEQALEDAPHHLGRGGVAAAFAEEVVGQVVPALLGALLDVPSGGARPASMGSNETWPAVGV